MVGGGGAREPASLVDDVPVPALLARGDEVVAVNRGAAELLEGLVDGDPVGRSLSDLFGIEGPVPTEPPTRAVLGAGTARRVLEVHQGPERSDGDRLVILRDVTTERFAARILSEIANATSIVDPVGQRHFGPIGREIKEGMEVPGSVADRVHPEDIGRALDAYVKVQAEPGARATLVVRAMDPLLEGRWAEARIQIINQLTDPELEGLIVSIDNYELTEEVESIARTSSSFLSVAAAAPVGIILSGPKGFAVYFNEAAQQLIPGVGVGDRDRDWVARASGDDRARLYEMLEATPRTGEWHSTVARFDLPDGEARWLMVTVAPRIVEDERVIGMVTTLQDVTEEMRAKHELEGAQQRLVHLASHDPLTGLPNRSRLTEELTARLATEEPSVAVLFCDLDGFKAVNDTHGHGVGDAVLAEVGIRLAEATRGARPGAADLVARLGGDEFVVVLDGAETAEIERIERTVTTTLTEPIRVGEVSAQLGVSIGVATARPGDTADRLLSRADQSMYEVKAGAREA